jgi:hypothetical protein
MRVLIGCEFSGIVRDAFIEKGFDAWSCDILPTERPGPHLQCDLLSVLNQGWDLAIFHPPCTYLTVAGARWFYHPEDKHLPYEERRPHPLYPNRRQQQEDALEFVRKLMDAPIPHIAIENPISVISSRIQKPDQIIQPWMFGHGETKKTCLWLKDLPLLLPTNIVEGRENNIHKMAPSPERWRERSRTFEGIGKAMGEQWGDYLYNLDNQNHMKF